MNTHFARRLGLTFALALWVSTGAAAPRVQDRAGAMPPVADAPVLLAPGINAPKYTPKYAADATWPSDLTGVWVSRMDEAQSTAAGTLTLAKEKTAKLEPEGMFTLQGFWSVSKSRLVLDTPLNIVSARYRLEGKSRLYLTFDSGQTQLFEKKS